MDRAKAKEILGEPEPERPEGATSQTEANQRAWEAGVAARRKGVSLSDALAGARSSALALSDPHVGSSDPEADRVEWFRQGWTDEDNGKA